MSLRNRSLAGLLIAGTLLGPTAGWAAPFGPASRPAVDKAPVEHVGMVCNQWGRCWHTGPSGAAVGAAIGLGILGGVAAAAAATAAPPPPPPPACGPGFGPAGPPGRRGVLNRV